MNPIEFFFDNINDTAKWIFTQQPIIIVLFLVFMAILLIFYATKTVSKQNSEDHLEKNQLIDLTGKTLGAFNKLSEAIESLKKSQDIRNESIAEQIKEQQTTNRNLQGLNTAFADYHTSLADTIGMIFKNQVTGRLDKVELKVDEIYDIVKNKPDCNDEILNRLNDLGKTLDRLIEENK